MKKLARGILAMIVLLVLSVIAARLAKHIWDLLKEHGLDDRAREMFGRAVTSPGGSPPTPLQ